MSDVNSDSDITMATEAGRLLGASLTTLYIYHKEKDEIEIRIKNNLRRDSRSNNYNQFNSSHGMVGHVIKQNEMIRLNRPNENTIYDPNFDDRQG